MTEIVQKDHKALRRMAKEVPVESITGIKIQKILKDMKIALDGEYDGVALAAPQIAEPLRIFIISPLTYQEVKVDKPQYVFINPKIIKKSLDKKTMEEGCLSVRPWYGKVKRSSRATVEAYNENGERFQMQGKGLLAQIFQHEIDHLDGILFTDKAKDLREIPEVLDNKDHE